MVQRSRPTAGVHARRPGPLLAAVLVGLPVVFLVLPSVGRLVTLHAGNAPADAGDVAFMEHPVTGLMHVVLGLLMAVLVPLQLSARLRKRHPRVHRVGGWLFALAAVVTTVTGLVMNVVFPPVGGVAKQVAIAVTGAGFVVSLALSLQAILRRDIAAHRAFMLRALACGLAGGTAAVVLFPYFLAFGQPGDTVVALGRWLSLVVDVAVVEVVVLRSAASRLVPA